MRMLTPSSFACSRSLLNSKFFYDNPYVEFDEKVASGLYSCIDRLVSDIDMQDKIIREFLTYKNIEGLFGIPIAIRSRKTLALAINYEVLQESLYF